MTDPVAFTTSGFKATDTPTARTFPDRLAEIKNVKDFGAKGDGVTDDWSAIMAAVNWTAGVQRGTIFFPPGTYKVSAPIDFSGTTVDNINICFLGVLGASTVTGNFADFVFKREVNDTGGFGGWHCVENLTIINTHATGGGVRIGYTVCPAVRNCNITANIAIKTASVDADETVYSAEVLIENCTLSPGSNPSGSIGIKNISTSNVIGCTITGFDTGLYNHGQQGMQTYYGCRIELCAVGIFGNAFVFGCLFKNCGTAVSGGGGHYRGVRIEGAAGTIAGNPQYGIRLAADSFFNSIYSGIIVTGEFQQYGISIEGGEAYIERARFIGVQSTNTGGLGAWQIPATPGTVQFIGCNVASVSTLSLLPAPIYPISSIGWSGGTTTLVLPDSLNPIGSGVDITVTIVGVTPSGYNGTFSGAIVGPFNTLSYSQSDPGSPTGTGGTATVNASDTHGPNATEGDCYNVSDGTNGLSWGAVATNTGTHTTHYKVRWNGTNWTVVGK